MATNEDKKLGPEKKQGYQAIKGSKLHQQQIERIEYLIPEVESVEKSNQRKYKFFYYLTLVVNFLTAGMGATILGQLGSDQTWGKAAQLITGIIAVLQTAVKVFKLEDKKNEAHRLVMLNADLKVRLRGCIGKMEDLTSDGNLTGEEQLVWTRIVNFIGSVDSLLLSMNMGQDLRDKIQAFQTSEKQLQSQGIVGINPVQITKSV